MKKIVAFGDSYAFSARCESGWKRGWISEIGRILSMPVKNYGENGTSINFSIHNFMNYIKTSDYDESDVFIFVLTEQSRIFSVDMPNFMFGSGLHKELSGLRKANPQDVKWAYENYENWLWARELADTNFDSIKTIALLKSFAKSNQSNLVILVNAFSSNLSNLNYFSKISSNTENFIFVIYALSDISRLEFHGDGHNRIIHESDIRVNHLCKENNKILTEMIANVITSRNIAEYDPTRFVQKVFHNRDDVVKDKA